MKFNKEQEQRLTELRQKRKFTDSDWIRRGLNPSDPEKVNEMAHLMNICLDELLADIKSNSTEGQLRKTLVRGVKRFNTSDYDTEEKEFIGDEFYKIGSILGLNISDNLNRWLYGNVLGTIVNLTRRKEVILDSRSFDCSRCKLTLTIKTTAKMEGVPDYWIIGQCIQCGEYNLLTTGENSGGLKFENFSSTEILNSNDTSEQEARTRLEQIKYFRGQS